MKFKRLIAITHLEYHCGKIIICISCGVGRRHSSKEQTQQGLKIV
jgi:hypothetical protein